MAEEYPFELIASKKKKLNIIYVHHESDICIAYESTSLSATSNS